jgi:hypothetical protein
MSETVKQIVLEDGRKAEKRIYEETVQEIWVEKPVPKFLSEKIIERRAPVIVEREIHTYDEDGQTVIKKETFKPEYTLNLTEVERTVVKEQPSSNYEAELTSLKEQVAALKIPTRRALLKAEDEKKLNAWDWTGIGVIVAQVGAIVYFLFFF